MHEGERVRRQGFVSADRKQGLERAHASADHAPVRKPERIHDLEHQGDHLDVSRGTARADQLEAQLGELAGPRGKARLLAHHRRLVAQTQRQIARVQSRGHQADDGQCVVRTNDQQAAINVEELERRVRDAPALLKRVLLLQKRGFHREVAMMLEATPNRKRDVLARLRLSGQDVPETPWCGRHLNASPSAEIAYVARRSQHRHFILLKFAQERHRGARSIEIPQPRNAGYTIAHEKRPAS